MYPPGKLHVVFEALGVKIFNILMVNGHNIF